MTKFTATTSTRTQIFSGRRLLSLKKCQQVFKQRDELAVELMALDEKANEAQKKDEDEFREVSDLVHAWKQQIRNRHLRPIARRPPRQCRTRTGRRRTSSRPRRTRRRPSRRLDQKRPVTGRPSQQAPWRGTLKRHWHGSSPPTRRATRSLLASIDRANAEIVQ